MTNPISNNPYSQQLAVLLQNMQNNPQAMAQIADLLHFANTQPQPGQPGEPGLPGNVQILLNLVLGQLFASLSDPLFSMLAQDTDLTYQGKPQHAKGEKIGYAQTTRPVDNPQRPSQDTAPKSERQTLAEMAVKLLSVAELGKHLVPNSNKEAQAQIPTVSAHVQIIAQIGEAIGHIEKFKQLVQNQKSPHLQAYLTLGSDRIKETLATLETILQNPASMGRAPQERLYQDNLLLSSLLSALKGQTPAQTAANPQNQQPAAPKEAPPVAVPLNAPMNPQSPIQSPAPATSMAPTDVKPPLPVPFNVHSLSANSADLIALIQAHLSKGIMQPVPIIIPFPVSFTMKEAINTTSSSSIGREKRAKNEEQGRRGMGGSGKEFSMLTMLLPPGPVIYGDHLDEGRADERPVRIEQLDAYLIAATPVTNAQYAEFISEALSKNKVRIEVPGKIYDDNGNLLGVTSEGAPLSQLEISSEGGVVTIRATPSKENHPVVHVTYDGALAYCIANGFRLPSESEWERAAGMMPTEYGQPLKKLRFGNSSDAISSSLAVYKEGGFEKISMNMTMPVAFFDGQRVYTKAGKRIETKLSVSPWGCYDMSGNAREWTSTSFGEEGFFFITKGGSYADTAFDLRVAAKTPLPRHNSDPYTTFRVAL